MTAGSGMALAFPPPLFPIIIFLSVSNSIVQTRLQYELALPIGRFLTMMTWSHFRVETLINDLLRRKVILNFFICHLETQMPELSIVSEQFKFYLSGSFLATPKMVTKPMTNYHIDQGKRTLDIRTATRKGIGTYSVHPGSYPFGGKPPKAQEHLLWTNQPATNRTTTE
jgi:hypothetical protein